MDLNTINPFATELNSLGRKKALMEALQGAAMSRPQGQMVGGQFIAPSMLGQLTPVVAALLGKRAEGQFDQGQKELSTKYGDALAQGVGKYFQTRDGAPGHELPDGMAGPQKPATPADPRRAAIEAMTSGLAPLQQLGQTDLAQLGKAQKRNLKEVDGVVYDADTGAIVKLSGDRPTFERDAQGDLYQISPSTGAKKKLDNSPKINNNVSVGGPVVHGQKEGMKTWAEMAGKQVGAMGEAARSATELISTLDQMTALADSGVYSGPTSAAATWLGTLAQSAGVPVDAGKIANSQSYNDLAKEAVQKLVAQYGGNRGITAEEAKQLQSVIPQLATSPQARVQLTAILRRAAERKMADYRTASKNYGAALKAEDPSLFDMTEVMLPNSQPLAPLPGQPSGATKSGVKFLGYRKE